MRAPPPNVSAAASLTVLLVAVAIFATLVIRRSAPSSSDRDDGNQIKGFGYVGAGALTVVVLAVVITGGLRPTTGLAEGVAILGFFAYLVYLLAAFLITYSPRRRRRLTRGRKRRQFFR